MIDLSSYQEQGLLRRPPKSFHPVREEIKAIEVDVLRDALLKQLDDLEQLRAIEIGVFKHSTRTAVAMASFPVVGMLIDAIVEKLATGQATLALSSSRISTLGAAIATEGLGAMVSGGIGAYAKIRERSFAKRVWRLMSPEARIRHVPVVAGDQLPSPS